MFFTDFSLHLNDLNTKLQGFDKTIDVMFDNLKVFEIKLKIFKRDVDSGTFKYFPNLQKHMADLEIHEIQTFRAFKCNFEASVIQLLNNYLKDLLSSDHLKNCKIHKMCRQCNIRQTEIGKVAMD
jgi:hypothetical protein